MRDGIFSAVTVVGLQAQQKRLLQGSAIRPASAVTLSHGIELAVWGADGVFVRERSWSWE